MRAREAGVGAVARQRLLVYPAARAKSRVDRQRRVALGENEAIAVRIVRTFDAQHASVQRGDDIGDGERRTDVTDIRPLRARQNRNSDLAGKRSQRVIIH